MMQIQSPAGVAAPSLGWLNWWTINTSNQYDEGALVIAAQAANLPAHIIKKIVGRSAESAWINATQIGAKGIESKPLPQENGHIHSRYQIRDAGKGSRVLFRESVDADGKKVAALNCARIDFQSNSLAYRLYPEADAEVQVRNEVQSIVKDMRQRMSNMIGKLGDQKLRDIVLDWERELHRVRARGAGGVYFIPRPADKTEAQSVEDQLVAMRKWVTSGAFDGVFSLAELTPGGLTTVEDFVKSAVEELKGEIVALNDQLSEIENHARAGSAVNSAQRIVELTEELKLKEQRLEEALGDEIATVQEMIAIVANRAVATLKAANLNYASFKVGQKERTRAYSKEYDKAYYARKRAEKAAAPETKGRKTGTAKGRASVVAVR